MPLRAPIFFGLFLAVFSTNAAISSPLPPCVKAASSSNGHFLVISDFQLEPGDGDISRVKQVTLQVLPRETFINAKDRITAPAAYWTDWIQWSVALDWRGTLLGCLLSLITDDGEFLVVLGQYDAPIFALRVYRRREHTGQLTVKEGPDRGVLVREISLSEIWLADKLRHPLIMTGATPQWFAGGTFEFSRNNRVLIHKTRWGNEVEINLENGSVTRK